MESSRPASSVMVELLKSSYPSPPDMMRVSLLVCVASFCLCSLSALAERRLSALVLSDGCAGLAAGCRGGAGFSTIVRNRTCPVCPYGMPVNGNVCHKLVVKFYHSVLRVVQCCALILEFLQVSMQYANMSKPCRSDPKIKETSYNKMGNTILFVQSHHIGCCLLDK